jgi:hypothetical protein
VEFDLLKESGVAAKPVSRLTGWLLAGEMDFVGHARSATRAAARRCPHYSQRRIATTKNLTFRCYCSLSGEVGMQRGFQHKLMAVAFALLMAFALALPIQPARSVPIPLIIDAIELIIQLTEHVDRHETVRWSDDATADLDKLMLMSVGITDELKQLNILLSKKPKVDFADFVEKSLKARIDQFETYQSRLRTYGSVPGPEQSSLQTFAKDFDYEVYRSCEYGPAAYETTYAATIVARALYKYIGRSPDEQKVFFEKVDSYFKSWLDQSKDDSPAKFKNDEEKQIKDLNDQLAEIKKSTFRSFLDKYYQTEAERDRHANIKKQLDDVVSQMKRYHDSLLGVIGGGQLLLVNLPKAKSAKPH